MSVSGLSSVSSKYLYRRIWSHSGCIVCLYGWDDRTYLCARYGMPWSSFLSVSGPGVKCSHSGNNDGRIWSREGERGGLTLWPGLRQHLASVLLPEKLMQYVYDCHSPPGQDGRLFSCSSPKEEVAFNMFGSLTLATMIVGFRQGERSTLLSEHFLVAFFPRVVNMLSHLTLATASRLIENYKSGPSSQIWSTVFLQSSKANSISACVSWPERPK